MRQYCQFLMLDLLFKSIFFKGVNKNRGDCHQCRIVRCLGMSALKNPFFFSVDYDVANKLYCPNILDDDDIGGDDDDDDDGGGGGGGCDDDDDDDKILKVILCYNVKAVRCFANLHMTGLCLYRSTVLLS